MKVWAYRTYVSCLFGTLSSFFLFICLVFCKLNACLFWNKCLKVSVGIKIHISSNGWTTRMVLSQSRQNPDSVPEVIPRDCSFYVSVTLPVLALMVGKWHSGQWQFSWESASTKRCLGTSETVIMPALQVDKHALAWCLRADMIQWISASLPSGRAVYLLLKTTLQHQHGTG